ncbi:MAG: GNAT family N-acetyltransferase [Spirochaetales bacterium]|nr:GNAT family N-acetyltransferase [Spirochaetales bacterium]
MVKEYANGKDFYGENRAILLSNKYTEPFFRLDSPLLVKAGNEEYALKVTDGRSCLLALCVEPYNIMLHGDKSLAREFVGYVTANGYRIKSFLCSIELGEELTSCFRDEGYIYSLALGMDFMEADKKTTVNDARVEHPTEEDVDELYQMTVSFIRDCGLSDVARKERVRETLQDYRILRRDGQIVSFTKIHEWTDRDTKISTVYTRDEYRNQGCARTVVGSVLNEIIGSGRIAVLNVDQKNPVSYHLYTSMGFRKIFSQGVFKLKS